MYFYIFFHSHLFLKKLKNYYLNTRIEQNLTFDTDFPEKTRTQYIRCDRV